MVKITFQKKNAARRKLLTFVFFFFWGGGGGGGENTIKDIKCKHMRETPCSTRSMT